MSSIKSNGGSSEWEPHEEFISNSKSKNEDHEHSHIYKEMMFDHIDNEDGTETCLNGRFIKVSLIISMLSDRILMLKCV
jgi:hypothetical protein